jgi:hypothetical protein
MSSIQYCQQAEQIASNLNAAGILPNQKEEVKKVGYRMAPEWNIGSSVSNKKEVDVYNLDSDEFVVHFKGDQWVVESIYDNQ